MTARGLSGAAVLLALATGPSAGRAQVFPGEVPRYQLSGSALVSYTGTWSRAGERALATHLLAEGLHLDLSGWLVQSRLVKFRAYALLLHLDGFGPARGRGDSLGYGGSLTLLSGSILPVTLAYGRGLAVAGSTLQPTSLTSTTSLQGFAQLVSPVLPRAELRAQRLVRDEADGSRTTSDAVTGSVYGSSTLHRYAAVATWRADQPDGQRRTTSTLVSLTDEAQLSPETRASFGGSLGRSTALGAAGGEDYTSYAASGALLTRLSPHVLVRGQYGYTTNTAPDREQRGGQAAVGGTIDLAPLPLLLGEGFSANQTRYLAPGLDRTVNAVSASQGLATRGRWGPVAASLSATGQAGYSSVSDGTGGSLEGVGVDGGLRWELPRAPLRASAFYVDRRDRSSAGNSLRGYGGLVSGDVSAWYPLFLVPALAYSHREQATFFAPPPAAGAPSTSLGTALSGSDSLTASVTGIAPLRGTRLSFSGGYADTSSAGQATHLRQLFGRVADAFRLGRGAYGNLSLDASHQLGQGTSVAARASLVWAFRASSLSLTYGYTRAFPRGAGVHSAALLFTRNFETSFLPESR